MINLKSLQEANGGRPKTSLIYFPLPHLCEYVHKKHFGIWRVNWWRQVGVTANAENQNAVIKND